MAGHPHRETSGGGAARPRLLPVGLRFVLELLPSILFLAIYYTTEPRLDAIIRASIAEACLALVLGLALVGYTRRVPWLMVEAAVLSSFSAVMTYVLASELWFKLKGTVIPAVSAAAILTCLLGWEHNLLQMALSPYYAGLLDEGWRLLALRSAAFQLLAAALNELLWRSLPFDAWVGATRVLGPVLALLFAALGLGPLLVHYQRRALKDGLSCPRPDALLPQVVALEVCRQAGRDVRAPAPILVELLAEAGGAAAGSGEDVAGVDELPCELLAGSELRLCLWLRAGPSLFAPFAARPLVPRLAVRVRAFTALCVPAARCELALWPTGAQRRRGAHVEFAYAGSLPVPASLRARGHWLVAIVVTADQPDPPAPPHALLEWVGSVVLVGRYSARRPRRKGGGPEAGGAVRQPLPASGSPVQRARLLPRGHAGAAYEAAAAPGEAHAIVVEACARPGAGVGERCASPVSGAGGGELLPRLANGADARRAGAADGHVASSVV